MDKNGGTAVRKLEKTQNKNHFVFGKPLFFLNMLVLYRPAQLAELSRSEFDPELFSHSAYDKFFCDIRDKSAVFNILRQNETIFDLEMDGEGGNKKKMRKFRE